MHEDTIDIEKGEQQVQHKLNKGKTKKTLQMQESLLTFDTQKSKELKQEYPKNDKVIITDGLSDVRVKWVIRVLQFAVYFIRR